MLISFVLFLAAFGLNEGVIRTLEDDEKYLHECSHSGCIEEIIFDGGEDYLLRVIVRSVNIDGGNGDFLLIKSGTKIDDGLTGRIFTHRIIHERTLVSVTNNLFVRFHRNSTSEVSSITHNQPKFSLTVQRFGSRRGNIIVLPDVVMQEYTFHNLTVHMTIEIPLEEGLSIFTETVARMAQNYVDGQEDLIIYDDISAKNVTILRVLQCPLEWPRRDICYRIIFAIPITLSQNSSYYGTHQLSPYHLATMWEQASYYFNDSSDIQIYDDHKRNFITWLIAIVSVTVLFAVLYMLIGDFYSNKVKEKMFSKAKQEPNKKPDNVAQDSDLIKFDPHPFQQIPPLFDNEVTFYEPDSKMYLEKLADIQDARPSIGEGLINSSNINYFEIENMQPRRETTSRKNYDMLP